MEVDFYVLKVKKRTAQRTHRLVYGFLNYKQYSALYYGSGVTSALCRGRYQSNKFWRERIGGLDVDTESGELAGARDSGNCDAIIVGE